VSRKTAPRTGPAKSRNPHAKKRNPIPATKSTATPPKAIYNYRNPPALDEVCMYEDLFFEQMLLCMLTYLIFMLVYIYYA